MIVVDTNIISYFYLTGEHSNLAESVYRHDPIWSAPLLWRSEFRNVLTLYLRNKILSLKEITKIITAAEQLLDGNEFGVDSGGVLELVSKSNCSAYDCEFVFLAQELNIPLITADKKLIKAFPKFVIPLMDFKARAEAIN